MWTATLGGGNLLPLIPQIVAAGEHISVGIGDYAYPELGCPTNGALIAETAHLVPAFPNPSCMGCAATVSPCGAGRCLDQ